MLRLLLSSLCFGLGGIAIILAVSEYKAFQMARLPMPEFVSRSQNEKAGVLPSASLRSQIAQMTECIDSQQSILFGINGADVRDAYAAACLSKANEVLVSSPTLSVAWLARSVSLKKLGNDEDASEALLHSAKSAPREGWLAGRRLRAAMAGGDDGRTSDLLDRLGDDVLLMLEEHRLREAMVEIFHRAGKRQDQLITILEQAPLEQQRAFLNLMRQQESDR